MVEPHSSNFRVIATNFLGVRIFWKFTVHEIVVLCMCSNLEQIAAVDKMAVPRQIPLLTEKKDKVILLHFPSKIISQDNVIGTTLHFLSVTMITRRYSSIE